MSTSGDRLVRVFTDRPAVRMSTVVCPGCGHNLDVICRGFERTPAGHRTDGVGVLINDARGKGYCSVDSDGMAAEIARAQIAQQAKWAITAGTGELIRLVHGSTR